MRNVKKIYLVFFYSCATVCRDTYFVAKVSWKRHVVFCVNLVYIES